jgi:hypothetical protein
MTKYENDLQELRPDDEIQFTRSREEGYDKITTAGHGYLVVPFIDKNCMVASKICEYGYCGKLAFYLEEDSEMWKFLDCIKDNA